MWFYEIRASFIAFLWVADLKDSEHDIDVGLGMIGTG